ncbi:MAG: hypothetical protein U5L09_00555 [Bacteroidales bacterium]|nr:hypothetical protein [Bacteroidales bacterium]
MNKKGAGAGIRSGEVVEPDDTLHRIIAGESSNILLLSPSGKQHIFKDIESLINFLKTSNETDDVCNNP